MTQRRPPNKEKDEMAKLDDLRPRWASYTHRHSVLDRIDPERWRQAEADLDLVDRLQQRLSEMNFPDPRGNVNAAAMSERLFRAARHSIIS